LETDSLVTLGSALGWEVDAGLRHLAECHECRARLGRLAELRGALSEEIEPAAGFAARMVAALPSREAGPAPARPGPGLAGVLNGVLAGATAFFAVQLAAGGATIGLVPTLAASLLVAALAAWQARAPSEAGATTAG
jgi:hypothetical protein